MVEGWRDFVEKSVKFADGSSPEAVVSSELITSIDSARKVGEELLREGVRQVILVYNVWNFPYMMAICEHLREGQADTQLV